MQRPFWGFKLVIWAFLGEKFSSGLMLGRTILQGFFRVDKRHSLPQGSLFYVKQLLYQFHLQT